MSADGPLRIPLRQLKLSRSLAVKLESLLLLGTDLSESDKNNGRYKF